MNYQTSNTKLNILSAAFGLALFVVVFVAHPVLADCYVEEYEEAMKQTEEEWQAVRQTMKDGSAKLAELRKKYQEYEDAAFSSNPEKGIDLAVKIFNLSPDQRSEAMDKVWKIREMFNTLDKNGIKSKLDNVSGKLALADTIAGHFDDAWEFAKKFDPAHAKDNPTYGLRLIGDLLKDGAGKMQKVPLVGTILGKWLEAYGEAAVTFANALDRLSAKIKKFRSESLCGQSGVWTDQQKAFDKASQASGKGESCQSYFAVTKFKRMRGMVFQGTSTYFLFDVNTCNGWIADVWTVDQVYEWHGLLLTPRALDAHWLASRANSLTHDIINKGKNNYALLHGLYSRSNSGWVIIEALKLTEDVAFYGKLDENTFLANYILTEEHRKKVDDIIARYEKQLFMSGTIYAEEDGQKKTVAGASLTINVGGRSFSTTSTANGTYDLLMEGTVGDAYSITITHSSYDEFKESSKVYERVMLGYNFTLSKDITSFTVSGTVFDTTGGTRTVVSGATVSATSASAASLGSVTTDVAGAYKMTLQVADKATVNLTATKGEATGATSTTVSGEAASGLDIILGAAKKDEVEGQEWTINVTVIDDKGSPLPNATVSGGPTTVTTGADGTATVGPQTVTEDPFTVTLTASVVAQGGVTVKGTATTVTYEGETPTAVTLSIPVIIPSEVTVTGRVTDANGIGVAKAVVSGGGQSATTTGGGSFSIGPFFLVKDSSVTLTATVVEGNNTYGGSPVTITFDGANKVISGIVIALDIETEVDVTISGRVVDLNGKALEGAAVTCGTVSGATDGGGGYSLTVPQCKLGVAITVGASITDKNGKAVAAQVSVTPKSEQATAPNIVIQVVQEEVHYVTISGRVVDQQGNGVNGASVSGGGVSTTTDGSGSYSLSDVECVYGEAVSISASATASDGSTVSGQASVTPQSEAVNAPTISLAIAAEGEGEEEEEDVDEDIDDLEDGEGGQDVAALIAEFNALTSSLDGFAGQFYGYYNYFMQRARELREEICKSGDAAYALTQAGRTSEDYALVVDGLPGVYGDLVAALADDPEAADMGSIDATYDRLIDQDVELDVAYLEMAAEYALYECDKDEAETESDQEAEDDLDPDDAESDVEICDDGIDNDGDGEIDECDAGCCDKNVQVTVTDCGNAADDVFRVEVDGGTVGYTPKGAANTFNMELSPGSHTVTVYCLDDGGDPLGSDIGTACVMVYAFGIEQDIGGGALEIPYGGSGTVTFLVPEGNSAPPFLKNVDGSGLPDEGK